MELEYTAVKSQEVALALQKRVAESILNLLNYALVPMSNSESKWRYDRQSIGQSVLVSRARFLVMSDSLLMWDASSDKGTSLSLTTAAGLRQRSHIYRGQNQ
jgi:hypothetical protein